MNDDLRTGIDRPPACARFEGPPQDFWVFESSPNLCAERDEDEGNGLAGMTRVALQEGDVEAEIAKAMSLSSRGQQRPPYLQRQVEQQSQHGRSLRLDMGFTDDPTRKAKAMGLVTNLPQVQGATTQGLAELCGRHTAELLLLQEDSDILAEVAAACERHVSKDRPSRLEEDETSSRVEEKLHDSDKMPNKFAQEEVTSSVSTASTPETAEKRSQNTSARKGRRSWTSGLKKLTRRLLPVGTAH
jgi:hypothetical protein